MTELEQAVSAWVRSYNNSELERPPMLWVGHWDGTYLGAIWDSNPEDSQNAYYISQNAYYMASPFAFAEVSDTFIIQARQRKLQVTRLSKTSERSIRITGWRCVYKVNDHGRVDKVRVKDKLNDLNSWVDRLCRHLGQARLDRTHSYTFDDALQAAIEAKR